MIRNSTQIGRFGDDRSKENFVKFAKSFTHKTIENEI